MSFDKSTLFKLLPAVYRIRDAEVASHIPALEGPLEALLDVFAGEIAVLEENVEQLYDDQFVETAAPWAVPYIGDLVGYRLLHGKADQVGSRRAEVAHTIAFRRRKGTASMLEQLARDVTGWHARVVEFFQLLATTQYMNHVRPANKVAPSLRDEADLEWVGTAFDAIPRTLDVRRIGSGGRYNIPNIGIFLWRIDAGRLERSPAAPDPTDATGRRFRFNPLGADLPLYTRPEREDEITHLADRINVPAPIPPRTMQQRRGLYYGRDRSIAIVFDGTLFDEEKIRVCNLADAGGAWAHVPEAGTIAIDPRLGRFAVANDIALPAELHDLTVTFHYGSPGRLGGGEYPRQPLTAPDPADVVLVPNDQPTIQDAIDALPGGGAVEITDNGVYAGPIDVLVAADRTIELRAAIGKRPTVRLTAPMRLRGAKGSAVAISGLVVLGREIVVPELNNSLERLHISHSTLVPGRTLNADGTPAQPGASSIDVERADVQVEIDRSIAGAVRMHPGSSLSATDSVIDASGLAACSAPDGIAPAGEVSLESCTVLGTVTCETLHASNAILAGLVTVVRQQKGCVRFSFVPLDSTTPRRFRCQPTTSKPGVSPRFTSTRYGTGGYCQLTRRTPAAIRRGADDESEMGVFRFLFQPQRESDLVTRLDEYLRIGLRAGIFFES